MSLFSRFNYVFDELGHILLSAIVFTFALSTGLGVKWSLICFVAGFLIDIDHVFNTPIAKVLKLNFKPHLWKGSNNYVIKILHGIDIGIILGVLSYMIYGNILFSVLFTITLLLHYAWDFVVFDSSWTSLFLVIRIKNKFYVPERSHFTKLIFSEIPKR